MFAWVMREPRARSCASDSRVPGGGGREWRRAECRDRGTLIGTLRESGGGLDVLCFRRYEAPPGAPGRPGSKRKH
jgi:hypothetical protein